MRFFEDLATNEPEPLGTHTVTEAEIVEFATQYDPLPFHTDPEAATETIHGELIASGYHTLCLANRILVDEFRTGIASVVGFGIDDLQWHAPVRPGDTLSFTCEITDKRPSKSRPGIGIIRNEITVMRDDEPVLTYVTDGMVEREGGGSLD